MGNRGGELAHGSDAVGMRQLALHLAILPLATGALEGNGGLRGCKSCGELAMARSTSEMAVCCSMSSVTRSCGSEADLSPWIGSFMRSMFLGLDGEGSIMAPAAVCDRSHGRPNRRCGQTSNVCSRLPQFTGIVRVARGSNRTGGDGEIGDFRRRQPMPNWRTPPHSNV